MNKHWLKLLGIVGAVLGFVQAYPGLKDLLTGTTYSWTMFFIGLGMAALGVLRKVDTTNWLNQWKTVLVGVVTAVISAAQGFNLTTMLSPHAYAWTMFALGVAAVVCGVLNSMSDDGGTTS